MKHMCRKSEVYTTFLSDIPKRRGHLGGQSREDSNIKMDDKWCVRLWTQFTWLSG